LRVWVRRMNMPGTLARVAEAHKGFKELLWHYIEPDRSGERTISALHSV